RLMNTDGLYERLMHASLRFISYRPRSEKELHDFLLKKVSYWKTYGGSGVLEKVVERMRGLGYVDDKKFASWWIDQRKTFKLKGNRLIIRELQVKGVSEDIIEGSLSDFPSEKKLAKQAIKKKLLVWSSMRGMERRQKIYRYLASRGFDEEAIAGVIDAEEEKE
ncbi:RecX family transcriptional regulator, partial [Candidatus Gottesmanbacteria bacterium]|nr:RecX family transcriptional regulator [Candidatus Gottesmanbacteria bacterium]